MMMTVYMYAGLATLLLLSFATVTQQQMMMTAMAQATPTTTTTALGQINNTSSAVEEEGPTIISLEFMPDGTGWLTLDNNGTLSPTIRFNHTLTTANGYIIESSIPFFTNNGTQVDVSNIDFSSQVTIDPNANVTLPAKPKISPNIVSYYSEQGSILSSQPPPLPPPAATTTPTPGASQDSAVIIDRPTAARLAAEDPYFARFEEVLEMCTTGVLSGTATMTASQCASSMQQGADRWCGIEYFDSLKCEYATKMVTEFNKIAGILGNFGIEETPSFGELFPGEPNLFAPSSLLQQQATATTTTSPFSATLSESDSDDDGTTAAAEEEPTSIFQSTVDDSFRVQIPEGWMIQDLDNTGSTEAMQGYGILAQLCPEQQQQGPVLPDISGSGNTAAVASCQGSEGEIIHIVRYPDLETRLGTTDDILLYSLQKLQEVGYRDIQIVNSSDMTLNLTIAQTNETIATVPAKLVEMTYGTNFAPNEIRRGYFISTATNATAPNLGTTKGYSVFYEGSFTTTTTLSPDVGQIFDSFELIAASGAAAPTPIPAAPSTGEYYTNEENGFRFQLPAGWVAQEPAEEFSDETLNLVGEIRHARVTICPEQSAQPVIGGGSDCVQTNTVASGIYTIGVGQYDLNLDAAAAYREVIDQGGTITTDDLLAFELEDARGAEIGSLWANVNIQVINERDRTTNLVDADTGEVIANDVQVKEVQYTYRGYIAEANNLPVPDEIRTRLFAVYNNPEGNEDANDVRAFVIAVGIPSEGETVQDSPPGETLQRPPVRTVFDSFELVE